MDLLLYQTEDEIIKINVGVENDTVWLTQAQMKELFERDRTVITRHINNVFKENEVDEKSNVHFLHIANSDRPVAYYSLDVIISVGYRVKSKRGVEFRRWANSILKDYIIKGYTVNNNRISQLGEVIRILKRTDNQIDSKQVLEVIERYTIALDLLDDYDHQRIQKPKGNENAYIMTYEECKNVISGMKFGLNSNLFGNEKDDSFKSSISTIYQTFNGKDVYMTIEEKAANLLYFITKNHSFSDGNKRIAATMFLYFLDKNQMLFDEGRKIIDDYTLVAITIMIAESKSEEKEIMVNLVMNFLV
ncbi:Fic/DOC family protein [[Clostridium] fimetarium]|uniref:Fic/DOC family protein n=2 Tax=[Clostridium] fimetarium TaxID=99656 RepID=A0A1I0PY49_9FIRM|nr:Fic/DOC family protein [[Clostridium] fimetarium]